MCNYCQTMIWIDTYTTDNIQNNCVDEHLYRRAPLPVVNF